MIPKWKMNILWLITVVAWPMILWLSYHYYYINIDGNWVDIFLFGIFMGIVAFFPLTIQDAPIFFVNGISIAVFLSFGLFVEIILTLLAVGIVLFRSGLKRKELYRIPLNMLMFSIVSVISAEIYKWIGGTHSENIYGNTIEIVAIFGYAISIFIVNQLTIKMVQRLLMGQKSKFFDKGLRWELTSSLLIIPVGFVLYLLFSEIGRAAIFYLSVPFISISVILKLLYSYQEINRFLKRTGEVGHQLAQNLEVKEVYNVFMRELVNLLPVDYAYVYQTTEDGKLTLVRSEDVENSTTRKKIKWREPFSESVLTSKLPLFYKSKKDWSSFHHIETPLSIESVLSLPIEYGDQVIGVVTVISSEKRMFEKIHHRILNILTSYLGVAIKNAKHYELTKADSEKDGLTKLYNYRYLENTLNNFFENHGSRKAHCSMIILDLDHFKMINDTYGHEAGNEILRILASRLKRLIGEKGLIARYGGEEFTIFLPDIELTEAMEIAEIVRKNIASNAFTLTNHILNNDNFVEVSVTASVGVASYPTHCETPIELIRYADRAMYIGAKRKGRNKVAIYNDQKSHEIV
ncbi:diguanylate cyclase [Ornithinibacillus sp. L9]|uniref:Diguanylate cyclase n=1 Tax=Ornithinibacillus caprae TaxID=2678566 RepID=A0A6N8FBP3_9BACI|nr:sensor domain-containing diguanylate cyclase [Ornithinibacillus caprae]MUK86970.1 diguanylate cyclase [Ornithinibacillus caprae]